MRVPGLRAESGISFEGKSLISSRQKYSSATETFSMVPSYFCRYFWLSVTALWRKDAPESSPVEMAKPSCVEPSGMSETTILMFLS